MLRLKLATTKSEKLIKYKLRFKTGFFFSDHVFLEDNSTLIQDVELPKAIFTERFLVKIFILSGLAITQVQSEPYTFTSPVLCYFMTSTFLRNNQELTGGRFTSANGRFVLDLDNMATSGVQVKDSDRGDLVINGAQVPFNGIAIKKGYLNLFFNFNGVSVHIEFL